MVLPNRRAVLALPLVAGMALANPALAMHRLMPLVGQWKLRRSIARELGDGAMITVTRDWQISFLTMQSPSGALQLLGNQLSVEVDAPAALAPFAQLERERDATDLFPIQLSPSGLIEASGTPPASNQVAQAVALAEKMFEQRGASQARQQQLRHFMSELQRNAQPLLDTLPPDLLHPTGNEVRTVQPVNLPGGQTGEFKLEYWARPQPDCGWLDQAERLITTTIGNSSRRSRETWAFLPL